MKQEYDHYVYHNVAAVTIPTRCPATTLENVRSTRKWAQEVCEPAGGPYSHVWTMCRIVNTHPITRLG